ncbi:ATP-binding cassette domain-containing protein [Filifactor alocis]|uniref:ATP-binding cassette domain-containing protein n=1 Tax=Filifactor alocis TaxID=143361 RepID=UPI003FA14DEC
MDITIHNLSKSYGTSSVLQNINFCFKEGEITFLQGSSGIGKTTLIRILMQLESSDTGTVTGLEDKTISAVFQDNLLCESVNVKQNLLLINPNLSYDTMTESLSKMQLHDCLNKKVSSLSGGMKRRVAILRALLYEFDVLIMDEPFKELDFATKKQVMDFVIECTGDKTVIIVTHDTSEYEYFVSQIPCRVNLLSLSK